MVLASRKIVQAGRLPVASNNGEMTLDFIAPFAKWLAATRVSALIGEVPWIVPAIQSVHIIAISVVVSGILMIDLRLLGALGDTDGVDVFTRRYLPWVWRALIVLLLTGMVMIVGEPTRSLQNATFVLKMALVLLAAALTSLTQMPLGADTGYWRDRKGLGRLLAVASLIVWVAIVVCGRWIAYTQDSGS